MNHLMIDLETMGNKPNAPIVAIGAVFFEPSTGETGAEFSATVSLSSEMALGAVPDPDTIEWWIRQSDEAREALRTNQISILKALEELTQFVKRNKDGTCQVWGNGAGFDNVILRAAYQRIGQPAFWLFIRDRDVRTMVELGRQIGFDPKRDIPFEGKRHDALADALHQAKYVSAIWQKIIPTTSTDEAVMFEKTFSQVGDFRAWHAAQQWLDDHGYSYGSTCAWSDRVGVLKGDHLIAKWRNLTRQEISELDGYVAGDYRDGPVTIRLKATLEGCDHA